MRTVRVTSPGFVIRSRAGGFSRSRTGDSRRIQDPAALSRVVSLSQASWIIASPGTLARPRRRKHEAVRDCGSYEVRFDDGRSSKYFYFDDLPNQHLRDEGRGGSGARRGETGHIETDKDHSTREQSLSQRIGGDGSPQPILQGPGVPRSPQRERQLTSSVQRVSRPLAVCASPDTGKTHPRFHTRCKS
jgi:hypothetical protein